MNPLKLHTEVDTAPLARRFDASSKVMAIGSCFASEIGDRLSQSGFSITINPFGTLYNPASIAAAVQRLANPAPFTEDDVIYSEPLGRYNSFWHHTRFSNVTKEGFLAGANESLKSSAVAFAKSDICLVTLGTAWVFRHIGSGKIVANCNKVPAKEFHRERLTVEETTLLLSEMIGNNPDKEWIFTVSPIRHLADGAYGNSLSKATLLLATERLEKAFPNVHYFPAFEIMMDELRDYRFYAENMTHPSSQASELIFLRFLDYAFSPDAVEAAAKARREYRRTQHRPLLESPGSLENMA
jgi:hypothetical protein